MQSIDVLKFDIYQTRAEDEIYWQYLHRSQSGWQHGVLAKERGAVEGIGRRAWGSARGREAERG